RVGASGLRAGGRAGGVRGRPARRGRRPDVTPTALSKATTVLLALAAEAAERLGAVAVPLLPEGPEDWGGAREAADGARVVVAIASDRLPTPVREAGLVPIEVEPADVAIAERITLALIEAVANDLVTAGARVVVVYSAFEADTLDSISVVRL